MDAQFAMDRFLKYFAPWFYIYVILYGLNLWLNFLNYKNSKKHNKNISQ